MPLECTLPIILLLRDVDIHGTYFIASKSSEKLQINSMPMKCPLNRKVLKGFSSGTQLYQGVTEMQLRHPEPG